MTYSLTWLPATLRAVGLPVVEFPGWQTRGHGDVGKILGVLCHHTASEGDDLALEGLLAHGRNDLPGPIANLGLTRDGTFYIENGQLKYPVKNFRFNESPVIMLNNIDDLGRPVRVSEGGGMKYMIPPMRVRDFTFTSLSDAV